VLDKSLSAWKSGDVSAFSVPTPKQISTMKIFLVDKPGAPQSEVRIGYPALARSTPDFFPVSVMNRMLGGQFTSRINLNLRERHGYTYGARSGFSFQKGPGPFTASGAIVTEKTDSALHEFLHEITLMRDKGMTADELVYVKKGLLGSFALTFETPAQIASALQNIVLYGLPDDYYQHYLQNIDAVSLEEVSRVSRQYLDASKMAVVVVGDLAKIRPGIESMKIADIVVCDLDGNPIP
jgi:zinc protease